MPWLVCRDFNEILYSFKKLRAVPKGREMNDGIKRHFIGLLIREFASDKYL